MGKKPIVSVTYENERISIKYSLPYLKCVVRLSCVVHGPIYGCFMVSFVNGFLSVVTARKLLKVDLKREPTQMLGFALNFFYRRFPNALEIINIKSDP